MSHFSKICDSLSQSKVSNNLNSKLNKLMGSPLIYDRAKLSDKQLANIPDTPADTPTHKPEPAHTPTHKPEPAHTHKPEPAHTHKPEPADTPEPDHDMFYNTGIINCNEFDYLNINNSTNYLLNTLYAIDSDSFHLVTNIDNLVDDVCIKILIYLDKNNIYKKHLSKKRLRHIIDTKQFDDRYFMMVFADCINFNLVVLTHRLVYKVNEYKMNRGTIVLFNNNNKLYSSNGIKLCSIIDSIDKQYKKRYTDFDVIDIKSLSNYKLNDLKEIINRYDINFYNKKLKKELYVIITKFFKLF